MKVNGETAELKRETTLAAFLKEHGYTGGRVAVELSGRIIPRTQWETVLLTNTDTLEIVQFVGGG